MGRWPSCAARNWRCILLLASVGVVVRVSLALRSWRALVSPLRLGSPIEKRRAGLGTPVFRFMLNLRFVNMVGGSLRGASDDSLTAVEMQNSGGEGLKLATKERTWVLEGQRNPGILSQVTPEILDFFICLVVLVKRRSCSAIASAYRETSVRDVG